MSRHSLSQARFLILLSLAFVAVPPAKVLAAVRNYDYTAQLVSSAMVQGKVRIGTIEWSCRRDVCTARGPWPTPSAKACNALARKVGRVMSYGHTGKHLGRSGLTSCNQGVTAMSSPPRSAKNAQRDAPKYRPPQGAHNLGAQPVHPESEKPLAQKPVISQSARIDPRRARATLNARPQDGPRLENVQRNCGVNFGAPIEVHGLRFGSSGMKRKLAVIADGGNVQQIFSASSWSDTRISAQLPADVRRNETQSFIGIVDNQQRLISNVVGMTHCRHNYRITGTINTRNCNTGNFVVRAIPIIDKFTRGQTKFADAYVHPSNDLALAYTFDALHTGTWKLEPVFTGSGCDRGVWTPPTVHLVLGDARTEYRQDFDFVVAGEVQTVPIGILTTALSQQINDLEIHLNNYNAGGRDSWHQGYASYIRWPSAGRFHSFNIPEISKKLEFGKATGEIVGGVAAGPLGAIAGKAIGGETIDPTTVLFYINDLNLPPRPPSERTVTVENGQFKIRLAFEGNGTEIKGRCRGNCPFGSDDSVPDATFEPVIEVWLTPVRASLGPQYGHTITYGAVRVSAANSRVQINGVCNIGDICNAIYNYRDKAKQEIEDRILKELDSDAIRDKVARAVRSVLSSGGIGEEIARFQVDSSGLQITHIRRSTGNPPGQAPRGGT